MNRVHNALKEKFRIFFIYHPDICWAVLSFVFLFSMLFVVRIGESSTPDAFQAEDAVEIVELGMSEPDSMPDVVESSDQAEPETERAKNQKLLSFGTENPGFNDIDSSSIPPRPLFLKPLPYPESMRKEGIEGVVSIELGIDETGAVVFGRIVRSLGRDFDVVVIEWAKRIRFYPAKNSDSEPVKCRVLLPVRFKLEG